MVAALVARGGNFLLTLAAASLIGIEGVGQIGITQGTIVTTALLASLGLGLFVTRNIAIHLDRDPKGAGAVAGFALAFSFASGTALSLALFAMADMLAVRFFGQPALAELLRLGAVGVLSSSVQVVLMAILAGLQRFRQVALLNLAGAGGSFALALLGMSTFGVRGAIIGAVAAGVLVAAIWLWRIRSDLMALGIRLHLRIKEGERRQIFSFILPALLGGAMVEPINLLCVSFLARGLDGAVQTGIYYYILPWANLIVLLPNLAGQAVIPILAAEYARGDATGMKNTLVLVLILNIIAVSVISAVVLFAFSIIAVEPYRSATDVRTALLFFVIANSLASVMGSVGQAAIAVGFMWRGFAINLVWALAYLSGTYVLSERGAPGIAEARLISYCVHAFGTVWLLYACLEKTRTNARERGCADTSLATGSTQTFSAG